MTTIQYLILSSASLTVGSDAKFDNRGCWGEGVKVRLANKWIGLEV